MRQNQTPRRRRQALAATALAAFLLAGCTAGSGSSSDTSNDARPPSGTAANPPLPEQIPKELTTFYQQRPVWKGCASGLQCATVKVPLNYDDPSDGTLNLALAKKKAPKPPTTEPSAGSSAESSPDSSSDKSSGVAPVAAPRLGSLLVNPGGPGGSAIEYLQYAALSYPSEVTRRYDMVAFDPRGVAASSPVTCLTDKEMDRHTAVDNTPDSPAEVGRLRAAMKLFAQGCAERSGRSLAHVSTVDAARDMDVVRALVGDRKLNYIGKSYGTLLGATYAELFPKRTGRLVLDGALDPSLPALQANRTQAGGFQTAFKAFAEDCTLTADCPLGTDLKRTGHRLDTLFTEIDGKPLKTRGHNGRQLSESLATTGVLHAMYAEQLWPQLRSALADAKKGDGTGLLSLSDQYFERSPDGSYSNLMYANSAVNCLDLPPAARTAAEVRKALPSFEKTSPQFGRNMAWSSLSCAPWPVPATGTAHRITADGSPPILVLGTTRDPATPYEWSEALAEQLDQGRLLTYVGDGHTAYARGSTCIDKKTNTFLLTGRAPAAGARCH